MTAYTLITDSDNENRDYLGRYVAMVRQQVSKEWCLANFEETRWVKGPDGKVRNVGGALQRRIVTSRGNDVVRFEFEWRALNRIIVRHAVPSGLKRPFFLDYWSQVQGRFDVELGVRSRRWDASVNWLDRRAEWIVDDVIVSGKATKSYGHWEITFDVRRSPVAREASASLEDLFRNAA